MTRSVVDDRSFGDDIPSQSRSFAPNRSSRVGKEQASAVRPGNEFSQEKHRPGMLV
ncbi:hypothetical protein FIBSPDRAFT_135470 [Athelia psychrophila]|uniref:Uncharacterized protein n=1 Tax=Athelia psychrophila TaxID=1759441 RepID=A0A166C695_9AGAM|nr:hypothetical protein FIBSPDRAFT_135470 [Fibularhizoctonia sp. CBS 109695]